MTTLREKVRIDYIEGTKVEDFFSEVAKFHDYEVLKPTTYHDIFEHWDRLIKKEGKKARVEVKGIKDGHEFGYTWIELKNWNGENGWLYGEADVLALMHPDRFDIYHMASLRKFIDKKVDKSLPILKAKPYKNGKVDYEYMKFRQYNGFDRRKDVTTIVSFKDIEKFKLKTLKFEKND